METTLRFLGGLSLFLYGMRAVSKGLTKLSGGKAERLLGRLCRTPLRGVLLGALVTAAIQSSSATTVMVVGFVNAGLMTLHHAVGVIMGANLGTTLTAWILSLAGISGQSPLLLLLRPASLSALLATLGTLLLLLGKTDRLQDLGTGLVGFGLLFLGMENMSGALRPLSELPQFTGLLTLFRHPLAGLAAGTLLTAVLQSSSAAIGILQALCATGGVTLGMAVPIVMGQNIGTCATALLASANAGGMAKRASLLHLFFNLAGTALFLPLFLILKQGALIDAAAPMHEAGVAAIHTVFNLASTLLLLPFSGTLVRLVSLRTRGPAPKRDPIEQYALLDDRFLGSPAFALQLSRAAFFRMCELSLKQFHLSLSQLQEYSAVADGEAQQNTALLSHYDTILPPYLVKLSARRLHRTEATELTLLMSALPDVARIAAHADSARQRARALSEQGLHLQETTKRELAVLQTALLDLTERTERLLRNGEIGGARTAEALCGVVEGLCESLRARHVERLRRGESAVAASGALTALICDVESVVAHCKRLAAIGVRRRNTAFDPHRPVRALRELDAAFDSAYHGFCARYHF